MSHTSEPGLQGGAPAAEAPAQRHVPAGGPWLRWRGPRRGRWGIAARLATVAGLLFVALAIQAGGAIRVAHELRSTTDRLIHDNLAATSRLARVQDLILQHQPLIQAVAAESPGEPGPGLAAHRELTGRIGGMLRDEAIVRSAGPGARDAGMLQRLMRDLVELDLTAEAVLLRSWSADGDDSVFDPQRAVRVYELAAMRIASDTQFWRDDRWSDAQDLALGLQVRMAQVARRAVLAASATIVLGLLGFILVRRELRQLGGITEAVLRVSRHERNIAIPGRAASGPVGDVARAVAALAEDVEELERRGIRQARTSQLLDAALNSMAQGLVTTGPDGRLTLWNRRFAAILDLPAGAIRQDMTMAEILAGLGTPTDLATLAPPSGPRVRERRGVATLGPATVVRVHWVRMPDGGWLGTFEDITQLRRSEARLVHLARHDGLTDLPNRGALREAVAQAIARARQGAAFALLSVKLDRMGTVNHALGHDAGDALIRAAAERLCREIRGADMIARTGANAFMVVQSGVMQPSGAQAMAERLLAVLTEPYGMSDGIVVVGASVGIALAADGDGNADRLMRSAELARDRARDEGGGVARFFAPEMDAHARARRQMELELHQALDRGEFSLVYQPLVSVRDRRVCGFEALLRWHHPRMGPVRPDHFIPVAEELGLIAAIGEWALYRACAEAALWPAGVRVAVNLSPVQFARDGLVAQVEAALAASGLAATRLELEITESVLLRDSAATLATLHRLRGLGVRISLDDFGTGYSSLSYLRSFPFDKIKIDKSFIRALDSGAEGRAEGEAIVRAILGLGRALGVATTAEGVETVAQLRALSDGGCTEIQGYLFSPPRPAGEVPRLLAVADAWPSDTLPASAGGAVAAEA